MTVDDTQLSKMLQSAYDKLTINGNERSNLKNFIRNCTEIIKVPKENNSSEMKDVIDDTLGIKMATTRRQAIYDKLLTDKTNLNLV